MDKNKIILADDNIGKLLFKLSTPAMIGMFVMSLYNIVDTIFVGQGVGTLGIAGVAIVYPIQMIVGALGHLFGIGGASLLSRSLGEDNIDKASSTLNHVVRMVVTLGIIITIIGFYKLDDLLILFGATEEILPYAEDYMFYILAGITFHSLAMALNNIVRAEGHANISMISMVVSAVSNIILDAIFIFGLDMGIEGAALATFIAYIISALGLLLFFFTDKSILKLSLKKIDFDIKLLYEIVAIGVSSFIRQTAMSLLVILVNRRLAEYGGNISIAVYGVVMKLIMMIFTPILGISQGLQPVIGFNYGARNMAKMKKSLKLAIVSSTLFAFAGTLIIFLFPNTFINLFSNDTELVMRSENALRFMLLAFPTVGFQIMGTTLFQATGKPLQTLLLSMSRQILFLIPLILILPDYFQLTGVWISFPISDLLAALLTFFMVMKNKHLFQTKIVEVANEMQ